MDGDPALNYERPWALARDFGAARCSGGWKRPLLCCQRLRFAGPVVPKKPTRTKAALVRVRECSLRAYSAVACGALASGHDWPADWRAAATKHAYWIQHPLRAE
jgi:hypothetical protein